jgi:hypothetical protein
MEKSGDDISSIALIESEDAAASMMSDKGETNITASKLYTPQNRIASLFTPV